MTTSGVGPGGQWVTSSDTPADRSIVTTSSGSGIGSVLLTHNGIVLPGSYLLRDGSPATITDDVTQGTAETVFKLLTIDSLGAYDSLVIEVMLECTSSAAAKRWRGRFGGTVLWNVDLTTHQADVWRFRLRNQNSQAAQVAQPNSTTNIGTFSSVGLQTFTVDFSAEQALTLTGQFPVAGAGANTFGVREVKVMVD